MIDKVVRLLVMVAVLCLFSGFACAGGGEEVEIPESVGDFDVMIDQIPLTKPTANVDIRVVVSERDGAKERVSNASVSMEVSLNDGSTLVMLLNESDVGEYTGTLVRNHSDFWGSDKLSIDVEKDGRKANIRALAPYIRTDPWMYAIFCLISAYLFGYGASIIFGSSKH